MSQISPPLRIALLVAIAFLAVWMTVLRPSSEEPAEPAAATPNLASGAPAVSGPGQVAEQAQGAAAAAETGAAARAGEAPESAAVPQASAEASAEKGAPAATGDAKAAKKTDLPLPVLRAIADKRVLVLLFWNPRAADDRLVRREVAAIPARKGKVFKHVAHIRDVSRYASITRGVNLAQSPTTVVVDARLGATPLVGFADRREIDQVVVDALRVKR
jgi:hypothetical protein